MAYFTPHRHRTSCLTQEPHLAWIGLNHAEASQLFSRLALVRRLMGVLMVGLAVTMLPCAYLTHLDDGPDLSGHLMASLVSLMASCFSSPHIETRRERTWAIGRSSWASGGSPSRSSVRSLLFLRAFVTGFDLSFRLSEMRVFPLAQTLLFGHSVFESTSALRPPERPSSPMAFGSNQPDRQSARGLAGDSAVASLTHFLEGMGIIVLGVAVLPLLGVGGMQLFKAEVPGPTTDKLVPRVGETSKLLWKVYLTISSFCSVLTVGGMNTFEAICHTMSTMGAGDLVRGMKV